MVWWAHRIVLRSDPDCDLRLRFCRTSRIFPRSVCAAAADGRFFSVFARLHPKGQYPIVAVLTMGLLSARGLCLQPRRSDQYAHRRSDDAAVYRAMCCSVPSAKAIPISDPLSYRMPLFPLPAFVALGGWIYIVVTSGARYIGIGALLIVIGIAAFLLRSVRAHEWPFEVV